MASNPIIEAKEGFWVASFIGDKYKDLKSTDLSLFWENTWVVPAGIAFVVMIIFLIFFKDEKINKVNN